MTTFFRFWKWIGCFLIIWPSFVLDGVGQDCNRERDSLALVDLYNATGGTNWTNQWNLSQPLDTWFGVALSNQGCVDSLVLKTGGCIGCGCRKDQGNNLIGDLPKLKLSAIRVLDLRHNFLNGTLEAIDSLQNLEFLDLSGNNIDGPLIDIYLPKIRAIYLNENQLTGRIPDFTNIANIKELYLSCNKLTGSIPDFRNISNLQVLGLSENLLIGNMTEFNNLNALTNLSIIGNELSGDFSEFENLNNLQGLGISNNKFIGELDLLNCNQNLRFFNASNNIISGSLEVFFNCHQNLEFLLLDSVGLKGSIPNNIGLLTSLRFLELSGNMIEGEIPSNISNLTNLDQLILSDNSLTGCFPSEINSLCYLTMSEETGIYCYDDNGNRFAEGCSYDFRGNPQLPWQGDFSRFCKGEPQISAPCDDGNPNTQDDKIQEDCSCLGEIINQENCRTRDSLALVDLFNSTNGENWSYRAIRYKTFDEELPVPNSGNVWDSKTPIDTWHGIRLDENGCVIGIFLVDNNLIGELPNLQFPSLKELYVTDNLLTGEIPDFSGINNIEELSCPGNQLTGSIPDFSNLSNLRFFSFSNNQL